MVRSRNDDDLVRPHSLRSDEPFLLHSRDASSLADGVVPQAGVLTKNSADWGDQVTRSGFWGGVLAYSIIRHTWGQLDRTLCNALQAEEDLPTNSPNLPLFSPMKHTPIDSSRSAVGSRNFLANSRTSVDLVKLARGNKAFDGHGRFVRGEERRENLGSLAGLSRRCRIGGKMAEPNSLLTVETRCSWTSSTSDP